MFGEYINFKSTSLHLLRFSSNLFIIWFILYFYSTYSIRIASRIGWTLTITVQCVVNQLLRSAEMPACEQRFLIDCKCNKVSRSIRCSCQHNSKHDVRCAGTRQDILPRVQPAQMDLFAPTIVRSFIAKDATCQPHIGTSNLWMGLCIIQTIIAEAAACVDRCNRMSDAATRIKA